MSIRIQQVLSLIATIVALMQLGILFSGSSHLSSKILQHIKGSEPDPTKMSRIWAKGYDRFISPFGNSFVSEQYSYNQNQLLYHFGVSVGVVIVASATYIVFSGTILGAMFASYYTMGFAPDLSNVIQTGAAAILLVAIAVIFDSAEKTVNQNI